MILKIIGSIPLIIFSIIIFILCIYYGYIIIIGDRFRKTAKRFGLNYTPPSLMCYPSVAGSIKDNGFYMSIVDAGNKKRLQIKVFFKTSKKHANINIIDKGKDKSVGKRFYMRENLPKNIAKQLHNIPEYYSFTINQGHISFIFPNIVLSQKKIEVTAENLIRISQKLTVFFQ
jgi:hypothetical protein